MHKLRTTIRPYAWGSHTRLAALQGRPHPTDEPEAELWIGAHPAAPSYVDSSGAALADVIDADPVSVLGESVVAEHGSRLPFLLKILAVDAPLSLQVHPDEAQARQGWTTEAHLPPDAPERSYRDDRPKPELVYAVTPFEALCGFRDPAVTARVFRDLGVRALEPYATALDTGDLRAVVTGLLSAGADLVNEVVAACRSVDSSDAVCGLVDDLADRYPGDPGVLVAMMLNQFTLKPGEAMFLGPGVLHAYLSGMAVEVMANSDNVLRGGLTHKHVNKAELLRVLRFEPTFDHAVVPVAESPDVTTWPSQAREFELSRVSVGQGGVALESGGRASLLLCLDGGVELRDEREVVALSPGDAVFCPATDTRLCLTGAGTVFRATTPPPLAVSSPPG